MNPMVTVTAMAAFAGVDLPDSTLLWRRKRPSVLTSAQQTKRKKANKRARASRRRNRC